MISNLPPDDPDEPESEYDHTEDAVDRKVPRTDRSGHPITDYSGSNFSAERQAALRCAELDYVNGITVLDAEGNPTVHYPSQVELAEKYKINTKTLAAQATKYYWLKRRKLVQHKQTVYETTMRIKNRRERGDRLQSYLIDTLERLQTLGAYKIWEMEVRMQREMERYNQAQVDGDTDYLPDAEIRGADIESMSRVVNHIGQSRDRIVKEIDRQDQAAIEAMVAEIEAPAPLPVAADEGKIREQAELLARQLRAEAQAEGMSETELVEILQVMAENERLNQANSERAQRMVQGELEPSQADDDEEEEIIDG